MILSENDVNMKSNDNDDDDDDDNDDIDVDGGGSDKSDDDTFAFDENFSIENEKEDVIRNEFSIEYMTNVVNFFDEKDSTGKRKHSYRSVQRRFKRVKDRNYIRRFRIHIANNGTKVRKLNLIGSFVYEAFNGVAGFSPIRLSPIRHSPTAKVLGVYWRKYDGLSPIGEIPGDVLAKVRWTFANWRNSRGCVGESTVDFRQLAKFQRMCWRKYSGLSSIGESEMDYLSFYGTILI